MKKILFLQPAYAHYREDLFSLLSERQVIHYIFEKSEGPYPGDKKPKKINCTFIDKKFRSNFIGLVYYLLKFDFDIIVSSVANSKRTIISFIYAIIFRKKFVLWILEWKKPVYRGHAIKKMIKSFKYWVAKQIITKSHALIVGGSAARMFAMNLGKKSEDVFTALQCSKDLYIDKNFLYNENDIKDKYIFLYLSRIISWKGLDILIKAFHLLRQKRDDVFLLIAGDGPFKEYCLYLAKSLGIVDIKFVGSINPDTTNAIYKKADVFVLPSYELDSYYETWGLVVNEAMSMKLPVITTTAVGASFDMIENGFNGFVVGENSVGELYRAMEKIIECDLNQMGNNSRKIFEEKNNFTKMANGFNDAIAYVI